MKLPFLTGARASDGALPWLSGSILASASRALLLGAACFACSVPEPAEQVPASMGGDGAAGVALVGGSIIDGTGAAPFPGTVLIRGKRIVGVGQDVPVPAGYEHVDVRGMTVLPGLTDVHGHLWGWQEETREVRSWLEEYSTLFLAGGVTTVLSPGDLEPEATLQFRDRVRRREVAGPRILVSGPYFGNHDISGDSLRVLLQPWLRRIDQIKLYTATDSAQLRVAVEEARRVGIRVVGHLGRLPTLQALELGIDQIEHGLFTIAELLTGQERGYWEMACTLAMVDLDSPVVERLLSSIVTHRVAFSPTLVQWEMFLPGYPPVTPGWKTYFTPAAAELQLEMTAAIAPKGNDAECLRQAMAKSREFTVRVHRRGGLVVPGTDPVLPYLLPGYALHRELATYVEAGLTPLEAIRIGTLNAAIALGLDDHLGSVAAGKLADLVIVRGDPARGIDDLSQVVLVFKEGRRYDPAKLRNSMQGRFN